MITHMRDARRKEACVNEFLDKEAEDLATHVENCQRRFQTLDKRLSRMEMVAWSILAVLLVGGGVTLKELVPIARALAGVP